MLVSTIIIVAVLLLVIIVPLLVGTYVYQDAKRRAMSPWAWVAITVLAPGFIGLVIYLLVRKNYGDLQCPRCEATVEASYMLCPNCGARFKHSCPGCGITVETGWKLCPGCGHSVEGLENELCVPVRHKDKGWGRLLAAVFLIPVIMAGFITMFSINSFSSGASTMTGVMRIEDYAGSKEVMSWIESCDKDFDGVYILKRQSSAGAGRTSKFLVYDPSLNVEVQAVTDMEAAWFAKDIRLKITTSLSEGQVLGQLISVRFDSDKFVDLKVFYENQEREAIVTEADYDF